MKKIKLALIRFINFLLRKKPTPQLMYFQSSDAAVEGIKPRYKIEY